MVIVMSIKTTNLSLPQMRFVPIDEAEGRLTNIWTEILKFPPYLNKSFFSYTTDMQLVAKLILEINRVFHLSYPEDWLTSFQTIQEQAMELRKDVKFPYVPMMVCNAQGKNNPLFFVHSGGSGSYTYVNLARMFGADQPFYAIESYNLFGKGKYITQLTLLAEQYIVYIKSIRPYGPYYLGGWSLGGTIAYEIAQQLIAQGDIVGNVYILDSTAYSHQMCKQLLKAPKDLIGYIFDNDPQLSLFPDDIKSCLRDVMVNATWEMLFSYYLKPYLGKAFLFEASEKDEHSKINVSGGNEVFQVLAEAASQPCNGWNALIKKLKHVFVPGGHQDIMRVDNLQKIAQLIQEDMAKVAF